MCNEAELVMDFSQVSFSGYNTRVIQTTFYLSKLNKDG